MNRIFTNGLHGICRQTDGIAYQDAQLDLVYSSVVHSKNIQHKKMKTFNVIYRITANDNVTEEEMLRRAEAVKDRERNLYKGDCALIAIEVTEISNEVNR